MDRSPGIKVTCASTLNFIRSFPQIKPQSLNITILINYFTMGIGKDFEELLGVLSECNPDALIIYDGERIIYANSKAAEFLGKEFKRGIEELMHPDYREALMDRIRRALKGEKTTPFEGIVLQQNGREIWMEIILESVTVGGRRAALICLKDLTEKKSAEKYREFFDHSLDIIVVTDLQGRFIEVNRAFEEALGYSRDEVIGKNFADLLGLNKEMAESIFKAYNRAFREKRDLKGLILEAKRRDGRKIIFEGNIRLLWERGRIVGFVGNYRDVTEKLELQERLKESEERYRKIFEHSPILIALVDENGVFIEANQAMIKSIGMEPFGKSHYELFSKEVADRRLENIRKAIEENKPVVFQDEREGRVFIINYVPVELRGKKVCMVIVEEITKLQKLNKLLREIIEVNQAIARIRDKEMLIKRVEEILSDYSAKIADVPQEGCFSISYEGNNYGYLCVRYSGEEEKVLLETLAKDIAFAIKTIEDEKKRLDLLNRLTENLKTFAFIVDRIRNPLAVISGLAETLVENEETRRKILEQVSRIVEIIQKIEIAWKKTEDLTGNEDEIFRYAEKIEE